MKNLFDRKILADVKEKLDVLESSFVDINWVSYQNKNDDNVDFIGLCSSRKYFLKKSYTFLPL